MVRGGSRRGPALIRRGCCECAVPGRPLRCWRLACGSKNHNNHSVSVSGNGNDAITMQTSSRRMVRFDTQASTQRRQQDPKQEQRSDSGRSGSVRARDRRATSPDQAWAGCLFRVGEHCLFETPNASLRRAGPADEEQHRRPGRRSPLAL
jgi:hypothetical protein